MVHDIIVVYIPDPIKYADRIKNFFLAFQDRQLLVFCKVNDVDLVRSICLEMGHQSNLEIVPRSDIFTIFSYIVRILIGSKKSLVLIDFFGKMLSCSILSLFFRKRIRRITFLFSYPFLCFLRCAKRYGIGYCITRGFFWSVLYGCFQVVNSVLAHTVVLQTEKLRKYVCLEWLICSKIQVVHNCLSVTSDELENVYCERFSNIERKLNVISLLFVGSFSHGKGAHEFLSLVELMLAKGIAVDARIAGSVSANTVRIEGERFDRFQNVGALRLMGNLERSKLLEVMRTSHYLIHFSICDGSARSVLEAMGMGVVPVVLDHPGLDFLGKSGCGLVYKSTTSDELGRIAAEMIGAKVEHPNLWREKAVDCLRFVEEHRSFGAVTSQWLSLVDGTQG